MTYLKEGERIDRLIREKIDIIQSKSVFSFSLDAVLLANFANVPYEKSACIVDACTGNGAVAFMLSAKTTNSITGIEYLEQLADMAQRTVAMNRLEGKVNIIQDDYKNVFDHIAKNSVDVITINPPYFKADKTSYKNDNVAYLHARHEVSLSLMQWVETSAKLLKSNGKLYCVHRPDRLLAILNELLFYKLVPKRIQFVHPKKGTEANIVLIEAVKGGKVEGLKILEPLIVYDDNGEYLEPIRSMLYGEY